MHATFMRKMYVVSQLNNLPQDIRDQAFELYMVLDRIEYLTVSRIALTIPSSLAMIILIEAYGLLVLKYHLPLPELGNNTLMAMMGATVPICHVIINRLICPKIKEATNQLRGVNSKVMEIIDSIDPDCTQNVGKYIK